MQEFHSLLQILQQWGWSCSCLGLCANLGFSPSTHYQSRGTPSQHSIRRPRENIKWGRTGGRQGLRPVEGGRERGKVIELIWWWRVRRRWEGWGMEEKLENIGIEWEKELEWYGRNIQKWVKEGRGNMRSGTKVITGSVIPGRGINRKKTDGIEKELATERGTCRKWDTCKGGGSLGVGQDRWEHHLGDSGTPVWSLITTLR